MLQIIVSFKNWRSHDMIYRTLSNAMHSWQWTITVKGQSLFGRRFRRRMAFQDTLVTICFSARLQLSIAPDIVAEYSRIGIRHWRIRDGCRSIKITTKSMFIICQRSKRRDDGHSDSLRKVEQKCQSRRWWCDMRILRMYEGSRIYWAHILTSSYRMLCRNVFSIQHTYPGGNL